MLCINKKLNSRLFSEQLKKFKMQELESVETSRNGGSVCQIQPGFHTFR